MRISDWSSDVCSSDLLVSTPVLVIPAQPPSSIVLSILPRARTWGSLIRLFRSSRKLATGPNSISQPLSLWSGRTSTYRLAPRVKKEKPAHWPRTRADRKIGVGGRSVSVRVDLGDLLYITTTIINQQQRVRHQERQ